MFLLHPCSFRETLKSKIYLRKFFQKNKKTFQNSVDRITKKDFDQHLSSRESFVL